MGVVTAAAAVAALVGRAGAVTPLTPPVAVPPSVNVLEGREAAIRRAVTQPSFLGRMIGVLQTGGRPVPSVPPLPGPSPADLSAARSARAALTTPLAGLLAAVREARDLLGPVSAADTRAALGDVLGDFGTWGSRQNEAVARPDGHPLAARPAGAPRATPSIVPALVTLPPASVVEAERHDASAALLVAAALDRYLPALRASATAPTTAAVDGCDLIDQTPLLCVGSEAHNTYRTSEMLLVDLGGDDTYHNSAGGAPFVVSPGVFSPLSVNVDLGGNDTYAGGPAVVPPTVGTVEDPWAGVIAQGAGAAGGVGILVDVAGDDRYSAVAPTPTADAPVTSAVAQGSGVEGLGALFDLGGNDSYRVTGPTAVPSAGSVTLAGQAGSFAGCTGNGAVTSTPTSTSTILSWGCQELSGIGALFDLGHGDDSYSVDAGTVTMAPSDHGWPFRGAFGQGLTDSGVALVDDDGGADRFQLAAATDSPPRLTLEQGGPFAIAMGQGTGFNAPAALLEGDGATTYDIAAHATGLAAWVEADGQGYATGGGVPSLGILSDQGGDDRYKLATSVNDVVDIPVDDSCGCPSASVLASPFVNSALHGQGAAQAASQGLLLDGSGDDRYTADVDNRLDVTLEDRLSAPQAPPDLQVVGLTAPWWDAQGASNGFASGALVDAAGTDSYRTTFDDRTSARATSLNASGTPVVVATDAPLAIMPAQGAVLESVAGVLFDGGGTGDHIEARTLRSVTTEPDPNGAFLRDDVWPPVQGAGGAGGTLLALGQDPVVLSTPSRPACPATPPAYRGFGSWTDCAAPGGDDPDHQPVGFFTQTGVGAGGAPGATGASPSLSFTADTPTAAAADQHEQLEPEAARLPAGARLLAPDGTPLAGVPVHFDLETTAGDLADTAPYWTTEWRVDAVTGPDGVARAGVPLAGTGAFIQQELNPRFRLLATYDGDHGLFPRHAASPLSLS